MNEMMIKVAEELAREYFRLGDNYRVESFNANSKKCKLVFSNDALIKVTVEIPTFLIEETVSVKYGEV